MRVPDDIMEKKFEQAYLAEIELSVVLVVHINVHRVIFRGYSLPRLRTGTITLIIFPRDSFRPFYLFVHCCHPDSYF